MRRILIVLAAAGLTAAAGLVAGAVAARDEAEIIVLSNSSPYVTVIDGRTHQVLRTADIPQMTAWTWNDDNNYLDGRHLWLGLRHPDTHDVEVILLDLDTLQVARRIPLGKDRITLYIGKPTREGRVPVSKHASREVVVIDKDFRITGTATVGDEGAFACDVDVAAGPGSLDRVLVPTDTGNTVVSLDAKTLQVVGTASFAGTRPFMLTASPDGRRVWVQERTGNSITVLNARTLDVVRRIPTGRTPIVGTFSPDAALHFTGHAADTIVLAHDTQTFREVWRARVGSNPDRVAVHPSGRFVYATASREGTLAVLEAGTGKVIMRIALGTNPVGLYVRRLR